MNFLQFISGVVAFGVGAAMMFMGALLILQVLGVIK